MELNVIAAVAQNNVIGVNGQIPWKISDDLKLFKEHTLGHSIIMGRKTYDSIGRALPYRDNFVVTRNKASLQGKPGIIVCESLEDAIARCDRVKKAFVIGGSSLYEQAIPQADKLYISHVKGTFEGDTFFPIVDYTKYKIINEKEFAEFTFRIYGTRK